MCVCVLELMTKLHSTWTFTNVKVLVLLLLLIEPRLALHE